MERQYLYLFRHFESEANVKKIFVSGNIDPPLSENGRNNAIFEAKYLQNIDITEIYSSPLLRARQSAELLNINKNVSINYDDSLVEIDVGELTGKSEILEENKLLFNMVMNEWEKGNKDYRFPEGESLLEVENRLKKFLFQNINSEKRNMLIVSHCLTIMAFLWLFCDNKFYRFYDGHVDKGKVTLVEYNNDTFNIIKFNLKPDELSG
jgi:broad specificity phosphatase PhoE